MKHSEAYIDLVMRDGKKRTARQVIEAIITHIETTPGKVSFAYVPVQRKVSHYLRTNKQYLLIKRNVQQGNEWAMKVITCPDCKGTMVDTEHHLLVIDKKTEESEDIPCKKCNGTGEIENELD